MKRVVAATDFSDSAGVAVRQGLAIAKRTGAELVVVHATNVSGAEPDFFEKATGKVEEFRRELRAELMARRDRLDELVAELAGDDVAVTPRVIDGAPDEAIGTVAVELEADLVVIGTRRGEGPILLGSIAERVVRSCPRPVLVARPPVVGAAGFERILVPTDFGQAAGRALELAVELAAPGAHVDVLHCWSVGGVVVRPDRHAELSAEVNEAAYARGAELLDRYESDDVVVSFEARSGHVSPSVLEKLDEGERHQLIALGTHGRRGWRRWLLGSVAEAMVRYAPCSVLVAPPDDAEESVA